MNANILDLLSLSCYVFVKCANYPKFIIHQQRYMLFCCLIAVQLLAAQSMMHVQPKRIKMYVESVRFPTTCDVDKQKQLHKARVMSY